jgi:hypothetical protein
LNTILILPNLSFNGGTRQALELFKDGLVDEVAINSKNIKSLKDLYKTLIGLCYFRKHGIKYFFLKKKIKASSSIKIISTSFETLEWVENISSKYHTHYFQHIEIWDLYSNTIFTNFCKIKKYPNGQELYNLVKKINQFNNYLFKISKIQYFYTVSQFLYDFIQCVNPSASIKIKSVSPMIRSSTRENKKRWSLFFLRGFSYKGDDIVYSLIKRSEIENKFVVFSRLPELSDLRLMRKYNIKFSVKPSDKKLSQIFSDSKIVFNTSYSEGFGLITIESQLFKCKLITSNTGWIVSNKNKNKNIKVIKQHQPKHFIEAYNKLLSHS